jgi:hypothetical protein
MKELVDAIADAEGMDSATVARLVSAAMQTPLA